MDLKLIERGNGGDLFKSKKDLCVIDGLENMVYLALFGGNREASTPITRLESEQAFDWWGNSLLFPDDPGLQFNSLTERTLHNVALTSAGRVQIESAVKQDLEFMRPFARVGVAVSIPETDKVVIGVQLQEPDNLDQRQFLFVWDATRAELQSDASGCGEQVIYDSAMGEGIGFWFVEEDFIIS